MEPNKRSLRVNEFLTSLQNPQSELNQYIQKTWCEANSSTPRPHGIGNPSTATELQKLDSMGGGELVFIYKKCNGLRLCAPDEGQGIYIYPINEISKGNKEWKSWFTDLDEDELWDFQKFGLAFGEIATTGNYLVVYKEQVFYADHEGAEGDDPWANSLEQFFSKISNEPWNFLDRML